MKDQPTITLKMRFIRHVRLFLSFLFFVCLLIVYILIIGGLGLQFPFENFASKFFVVCYFVLFLYFTAPTFFIHLNYYKRNRNEEYEIGKKTIIRRKNGIETTYKIDDVDHIYLYQNLDLFASWRRYKYVKIVMKSGERLYLTSLLYPSGLEKLVKIYMKKHYYTVNKEFVHTV
jgi:hypothetical protein